MGDGTPGFVAAGIAPLLENVVPTVGEEIKPFTEDEIKADEEAYSKQVVASPFVPLGEPPRLQRSITGIANISEDDKEVGVNLSTQDEGI